jgi:hypothetical protein
MCRDQTRSKTPPGHKKRVQATTLKQYIYFLEPFKRRASILLNVSSTCPIISCSFCKSYCSKTENIERPATLPCGRGSVVFVIKKHAMKIYKIIAFLKKVE